MFQEIPVNDAHIVAFRVVGKLTPEDYQDFLPRLEPIFEQAGRVSLLLELENFHGWEREAVKADYRFGERCAGHVARLAVVGEKRWEHWLAALAHLFVDAEIRYFDRERIGEAWDWLREPFDGKQPSERGDAQSAPATWRHVLMPTDFSPHAGRAVLRAADIAHHYQARLTLLHAVEEVIAYDELYDPLWSGFSYPLSYNDAELTQLRMQKARERLNTLAAEVDLAEVQVEVILGTPKGAILSYVEAQQVDVVVMGSHGRKGLARLLGSTTHAVLNSVRCDVLSVPLQAVAEKVGGD